MRLCSRSYWSQMRDAQYLSLIGNLSHAFAYSVRCFSSHIGIHFIKYQNRNGILSCQHCLESQHHPGQFA